MKIEPPIVWSSKLISISIWIRWRWKWRFKHPLHDPLSWFPFPFEPIATTLNSVKMEIEHWSIATPLSEPMYWRWRWRLSPSHDIYHHLYLHLNSLQLLEASVMEKLSNNSPLQHYFEPIGDHGDGNWTPHYMIHFDLHNHLNPLHATTLNHWRWRSCEPIAWSLCTPSPFEPIATTLNHSKRIMNMEICNSTLNTLDMEMNTEPLALSKLISIYLIHLNQLQLL